MAGLGQLGSSYVRDDDPLHVTDRNHGERVSTDKYAATLAHRIENHIISRGWPVGALLGSEADLIDRYGVSRGVLREAIRLLEHKQVVRMRSGPGGGLIVAAPAAAAVAENIANYFVLSAVANDEIFEARRALEADGLNLAAERLSERGIDLLRRAADSNDPTELHRAIGVLTRNPALAILLDSLARATPVPSWTRRTTATVRAEQRALAEALTGGDLAAAHLVLRALLDREEAEVRAGGREVRDDQGRAKKLPEQIARRIAADIRRSGADPGDVIGPEHEFLERYAVSRSVFRQAIRILEYADLVEVRAGAGGGVAVGAGEPGRVVDGAVTYLDFMEIAPHYLSEARRSLELSALHLTMQRIDGPARARLRDELALEGSVERSKVYEHGPDFHLLLAALSKNRPMVFFTRVLTRLQTMRIGARQRSPEERVEIGTSIVDAHARVAEAVLAGDQALARHRLRRHLDAMVANVAARRVVDAAGS